MVWISENRPRMTAAATMQVNGAAFTCVAHCLHFLDVSNAQCKSRIKHINEQGEHPFVLSEETFDLLTQYFVAPTEEECLTIVKYNEG